MRIGSVTSLLLLRTLCQSVAKKSKVLGAYRNQDPSADPSLVSVFGTFWRRLEYFFRLEGGAAVAIDPSLGLAAPRYLEGCAPAQPLLASLHTISQFHLGCPGGQSSTRR